MTDALISPRTLVPASTPLEGARSQLAERMWEAWRSVRDYAARNGLTLRTAATALAVERVTEAYRLRGLSP